MRGMGGVLGFGGGGLRVWDEGLVLVYAKSFTKLTFWLRSSGISGSLNWGLSGVSVCWFMVSE